MLGGRAEEWRVELRKSNIELARGHSCRHQRVGGKELDAGLQSLAGEISFTRDEESTGAGSVREADADTFGIGGGGAGRTDDKAKRDGSGGDPGVAPHTAGYHDPLSIRATETKGGG